jgi:hypothetical protein
MSSFKKTVVALFALMLLVPAFAMAYDMNVVADEANRTNSQKWLDLLAQNEITVVPVAPADIDKVKQQKYITIIGGVDDAAIKKLVTEVAGADEAAAMAKPGAKKMLVKDNVWSQGQKVLLFTGSDKNAAAEARVESRETWMPLLEEWFELDEGPAALKAY